MGIDFGRQFPREFVELTFAIASRQLWDGSATSNQAREALCIAGVQGNLAHKKTPTPLGTS